MVWRIGGGRKRGKEEEEAVVVLEGKGGRERDRVTTGRGSVSIGDCQTELTPVRGVIECEIMTEVDGILIGVDVLTRIRLNGGPTRVKTIG